MPYHNKPMKKAGTKKPAYSSLAKRKAYGSVSKGRGKAKPMKRGY